MRERRFARSYKVIFTLLLFQVGENWVSKQDKIRNDLQGSQDSLETKRKRYYHGLPDIFFFLRTIKHEHTLFQTRKMIFSTRTLLT